MNALCRIPRDDALEKVLRLKCHKRLGLEDDLYTPPVWGKTISEKGSREGFVKKDFKTYWCRNISLTIVQNKRMSTVTTDRTAWLLTFPCVSWEMDLPLKPQGQTGCFCQRCQYCFVTWENWCKAPHSLLYPLFTYVRHRGQVKPRWLLVDMTNIWPPSRGFWEQRKWETEPKRPSH